MSIGVVTIWAKMGGCTELNDVNKLQTEKLKKRAMLSSNI